jgi:hypothetical protein
MRTISGVEKQILYNKYVSEGMCSYEANKKIKNFVNKLKKRGQKLKEQNKPKEDINKRFKEEFEKLCQEIN